MNFVKEGRTFIQFFLFFIFILGFDPKRNKDFLFIKFDLRIWNFFDSKWVH